MLNNTRLKLALWSARQYINKLSRLIIIDHGAFFGGILGAIFGAIVSICAVYFAWVGVQTQIQAQISSNELAEKVYLRSELERLYKRQYGYKLILTGISSLIYIKGAVERVGGKNIVNGNINYNYKSYLQSDLLNAKDRFVVLKEGIAGPYGYEFAEIVSLLEEAAHNVNAIEGMVKQDNGESDFRNTIDKYINFTAFLIESAAFRMESLSISVKAAQSKLNAHIEEIEHKVGE